MLIRSSCDPKYKHNERLAQSHEEIKAVSNLTNALCLVNGLHPWYRFLHFVLNANP